MIGVRSYIAVLCVMLLAAPASCFAADPPQSQTEQAGAGLPLPLGAPVAERSGLVGKITNPYRPVTAPPNNLANTSRLDSLLRAGNLYLSLQDTIALALENNLDIAIQRYGPLLADAALRQALAGGSARGVSTSVLSGPSSASVSSSGYHGRHEQQRRRDLQQRHFERRGCGRDLFRRTGDSQPGPGDHRHFELGPFDHAAEQRVPHRDQFADPTPVPEQLRNPAELPYGHHRQPRA